jgi:hypothetical protein
MNALRRVTLSTAGFVLICFFLPWVQVSCLTLRDSASGFELARRDNQMHAGTTRCSGLSP